MKVCNEPGCPNLQAEPRCPKHRRERERARGTAQQRGYDLTHTRLRARYQRRMNAGERFTCWRCGTPIDPNSWDLGHDDADRARYRGPECVPCNRATSGRQTTQVTVVCGPPCVGKTTWVRERAQPGDLVVDYDDIAQRLGSPRTHDHHPSYLRPVEAAIARAIAGIRQGRHQRAWVVRTNPARAQALADSLGATLVILDEPDDVLHHRAATRDDPDATRRAIEAWRLSHQTHTPQGVGPRSPSNLNRE